MNISCNPKYKYVADNFLCVRSSRMKDYTSHLGVSYKSITVTLNLIKLMRIFNFLHSTVYLNTKKSIPINMFVLTTSGKYDHHIYFTFLQVF